MRVRRDTCLLHLQRHGVHVRRLHATPLAVGRSLAEVQGVAKYILAEFVVARQHLHHAAHHVARLVARMRHRVFAFIHFAHEAADVVIDFPFEEAHHAGAHLRLLHVALGGTFHDGAQVCRPL